jgi:hypothetical protein
VRSAPRLWALVILGWLVVNLAVPAVAMGDQQPQRPLWGAYIPEAPQNPRVLDDFESLVGGRPDIIHWYQSWGATNATADDGVPVDRSALDRVAARGAIPLLTWEAFGTIHGQRPARLATIPSGAFDAYIDRVARSLQAYGKPVLLRPFHEMNNANYPWAVGQSGNSAADLIRAWQYMHDRFSQIGATNVRWVWSPNTENDQVAFADIYPGDQYVDWLAVDGYNGGSSLPWGGWIAPTQLFKRSYSSLSRLNADKPIMIAETSSVEQGGVRAEWITELYRGMPRAYPRVQAIVWFQADTTNRGEADWRIQTSPESVAAFRDAISR